MVLVFLAYRGWLHAQEEQEQERERTRMQTLYEAGKELSGPLELDYDFGPFLGLVRKMFDASAVELVMPGDDVRVFNSEVGLALQLPSDESHPPFERFVSVRPGSTTYLAPVGEAGVGRPGDPPPGPPDTVRDLDRRRARLAGPRPNRERTAFHETMDQRSHLSDVISNTSDGIFVVDAKGNCCRGTPPWSGSPGLPRKRRRGRRATRCSR